MAEVQVLEEQAVQEKILMFFEKNQGYIPYQKGVSLWIIRKKLRLKR